MAPKNVRRLKRTYMEKQLYASLPEFLARPYVSRLWHWMEYKGPEWTATRLKAVWNTALLLRSGQSENIRQVCLESRIAYDSKRGVPKGIEGSIVIYWSRLEKPSKIRRAATALRAYTAIRLTNESHRQVEKARKSITSPTKGREGWSVSQITRRYWQREINHSSARAKKEVLTLIPWGGGKPRKPLQLGKLQDLSGTSRYPALIHIPSRDMREIPYLSLCASIMTKGKVPRILVEKLGEFSFRENAAGLQEEMGDPTYGKITLIQEGGAKGRVVCSPNAWVQYYCKPYSDYLFRCLSTLERNPQGKDGWYMAGQSCALDQVRGVYTALNRLNSGSFCQAVDLSSATDRFPRSLQQITCQELGIPEFGMALDELAGPYWGLDDQRWSYAVGQPMGLYGSFPLFHMTHFALLNGLAYQLGLTGNDNFCVLGDDVLIFDEKLLGLYLNILEEYQVPISWHKSYSGNLVEFAGFLITKSGNSWTAFRPYKFGPQGSFTGVLNTLHALGVKTASWSKYWAKAFEVYTHTNGMRSLDLSPLVPSEPEIRKDDNLPGYGELGSIMNQVLYRFTDTSMDLDWIPESWQLDRYDLCQTQIPVGDPYYYGYASPTDRIIDTNNFDPRSYTRDDLVRKRSLMWMFGQDPLVRAYMHDGDHDTA